MNEIEFEKLRQEVEAISASVAKLRNSGVSDRALVMLIQHASPSLPRYAGKVKTSSIRAVMDGMERLADYVFGGEEEDSEE